MNGRVQGKPEVGVGTANRSAATEREQESAPEKNEDSNITTLENGTPWYQFSL